MLPHASRRAALAATLAFASALGACRDPLRPSFDPDAELDAANEMLDAMSIDGREDVQSDRPFRCPGTGTEVRGTVLTPNGEDPVPGAVVYAVQGTPPAIDPGVACDTCQIPSGALAFTQTGIDGVFSLQHVLDAGGEVNVVIQKGRFRRVVPVRFDGCNALALDAAQTRLPGRRSEGDMPRILVATNVLDNISRVLNRVGIMDFDTRDGCRTARAGADLTRATSCPFGALLADRAQLEQYNIVFAPCGALGFDHSGQIMDEPQNARIVANLREFVSRGGRLYASDTAYTFFERVLPGAVLFAMGNDAQRGTRDPANVGAGGSPTTPRQYTGRASDPELNEWLRARGALMADGTLTLGGFIGHWGAIDTVPASTRTWVRGEVEWWSTSGTGSMPVGERALTVTSDARGTGAGCGRAVFTSYEVDPRTMSTTLTPQERVLEWLLFELGGCVQPPG